MLKKYKYKNMRTEVQLKDEEESGFILLKYKEKEFKIVINKQQVLMGLYGRRNSYDLYDQICQTKKVFKFEIEEINNLKELAKKIIVDIKVYFRKGTWAITKKEIEFLKIIQHYYFDNY